MMHDPCRAIESVLGPIFPETGPPHLFIIRVVQYGAAISTTAELLQLDLLFSLIFLASFDQYQFIVHIVVSPTPLFISVEKTEIQFFSSSVLIRNS